MIGGGHIKIVPRPPRGYFVNTRFLPFYGNFVTICLITKPHFVHFMVMNDTNYIITERKKKLAELIAAKVDPYPARCQRTHTAQAVVDGFDKLAGQTVTVAGRLMAKRGHGKLSFFTLQDGTGSIQLLLKLDTLGDAKYQGVKKIDVGDFLQANGKVFKTQRGEKSIEITDFTLLAKSIRPLPEKWHGLQDEEKRYRQRYLDFLLNPELRDMFRRKAIFWNTMRTFLSKRGFQEVETPVLETTAGGADANPFVTHHDALDVDVYLRISLGELWQKRLMVGGFEKTFEIGRQFRNEGISPEHLQDYTQMECYWAYADYEDMMKLVEELYRTVAHQTFGKTAFAIHGFKLDLAKEWPRIEYLAEIKKQLKIDILSATREEVMKKLDELHEEYESKLDKWRLVDQLWKHCRKKIGGPTFVIHPPAALSPLAKKVPGQPELVQRFWVLLGGSENGNGYSELNDPADQRQRFEAQAKLRAAGDKEAQMNDVDFVEALEYGMPPVSGFGVSERLFAFLCDKPMRETVMFPLLKPERGEVKLKTVKKDKIK